MGNEQPMPLHYAKKLQLKVFLPELADVEVWAFLAVFRVS